VKVIIAGSRSIVSFAPVAVAVESSGFKISEVVSGCAKGVDISGEVWAQIHKVAFRRFHADWGRFDSLAGLVRNEEMAEYADALVAVWDGVSAGTKHMIWTMQERRKPTFTYTPYNGNKVSWEFVK
jgi:hypothetical protein